MPTPFQAVLTGAGVSAGIKNALNEGMPLGDALTRTVWEALVKGQPDSCDQDLSTPATDQFAMRLFRPAPGTGDTGGEDFSDLYGVRLEYLAEIIFDAFEHASGEGAAQDWLGRVYRRAFTGGIPDMRHRVLGEICDREKGLHITVNMDRLLEASGESNVLHLHGTYDDAASIKTTVRQYFSGLDVGMQARLKKAIEGKDVLVAGYSGRDRDVLPFLWIHQPRSITWLHHPGSVPSREYVELRRRCDEVGIGFRASEEEIPEFGRKHIDPARYEELLRSASPSSQPDVEDLPRLESDTPARLGAILHVISFPGTSSLADQFIAEHREQFERFNCSYVKPLARFHSASGHHGRAISTLLLRPITSGTLVAPRGVRNYVSGFNEALAMMRRAGRRLPLDAAVQFMWSKLGRDHTKTLVALRQRVAHSKAMRGQVIEGTRESIRFDAETTVELSPQIRVNWLTFYSDYLRAGGYYDDAARVQREALLDAPFAMSNTRVFLLMMRAHLVLTRGNPAAAIQILDIARHLEGGDGVTAGADGDGVTAGADGDGVTAGAGDDGVTAGADSGRYPSAASNISPLGRISRTWVALVRANALTDQGELDAAERALSIALRVDDAQWTHAVGPCLARLHWIALLRAKEDYGRCIELADALIMQTRRKPTKFRHIELCALLLRQEVVAFQTDRGRRLHNVTFTEIARGFSRLGYAPASARALISGAKAGEAALSAAQIDAWWNRGWVREVQWYQQDAAALAHWVLPV